MSVVGIIDYGVGNLRSIANALRAVGARHILSASPAELLGCDRLILPGVGAFAHGMDALKQRGLDGFIRDRAELGTPLLGICLGMQLLLESSSEFGTTQGLGLLPSAVDRIGATSADGEKRRLPNVNWLPLDLTLPPAGLARRLLADMPAAARFYFVHSYCAPAASPATAATARYQGIDFAAVVAQDNIVGTQFHPEKSGADGLRILSHFVA
ncbi:MULTISPECIES: imidazole glycerol phosphate synthase subunit HisH [unclassified Sphingomonas]|uniref:imidazole glycerol phosphate synthase subunit HisH n=1 Tax=unclassified Sphingomonas TaxID=196159 RepID=UPI0006F3160F|nr:MULTISPECIES: imidazole glycerol phosphate synthase subunit HisH [unclassified Sphingomonas]KQX19535.1 hypothetical protein ASD17_13555 [Sphingomonas sp. Root1294]KQY65736.1 hypothetical protein ASD39_16755 [Sphingomonas sp. Root50]KRB94959.1 hypothetical protein ASE22_03300 [Sphingomonas sp. Root720]